LDYNYSTSGKLIKVKIFHNWTKTRKEFSRSWRREK